MTLVGFKGRNHPQQTEARGADDLTDDRGTPPEIFDPLHAQHGFTLDAAASATNAKVSRFFTKEQDGLQQSWAKETVWCNPPYSNLRAWVRKAFDEVFKGDCPKAVLLLPANRCEQSWWQDFIEPTRDRGAGVTTAFRRGRDRFIRPPGTVVPRKGDRPPFGVVVVTLEKDLSGGHG